MCNYCNIRASVSRRGFLKGTGYVAAAAAVVPAMLLPSGDAWAQPAPVSPTEAASRLMAGNARYVAGTPRNNDYSVSRAERALGQTPFASVVSCADSRVAPELVFDQGPGDLFVIRVAGNFVNEDGLASLEFGSAVLGSQLILVLGHSGCGAIQATIDVVETGTELPGHLPALAAALRPGVEQAIAANPHPADLLAEATIENVRVNVANLKAANPILADLVANGKLEVVGGIYDIATGKVAMV